MHKTIFGQNSYFTILPFNKMSPLLKFCTTNNDLPVNRLRFESVPRNERLCTKCQLGDIGDEFHYLFVCPFFEDKRLQLIPKYYHTRPNAHKFSQLLLSKKKSLLLSVSQFAGIILNSTKIL
jgi:hypothetical protein